MRATIETDNNNTVYWNDNCTVLVADNSQEAENESECSIMLGVAYNESEVHRMIDENCL